MFEINNEFWTILFVPQYDENLRRMDGTFTIGVCDNNLKTIFICENLNPLMMKKVLSHEITHAAMFSYDIRLSLEKEELLADLIATYGQEIICITNKIFHRLIE